MVQISPNAKREMLRDPQVFAGQNLGDRPHIGIVFCDSIGDFIVASPLMSAIRESYPLAVIDYFGGPRTASAEAASRLIDDRCDIFGDILRLPDAFEFIERRQEEAGPYDLIVNLDDSVLASVIMAIGHPKYSCGKLATSDGRGTVTQSRDGVNGLIYDDWTAPDLMRKYGKYMNSRHISHIFCALAHFPYPDHVESFPWEDLPGSVHIPDIVISLVSSSDLKMWPVEHWHVLVSGMLTSGYSVGIIGTGKDSADRYHVSWQAEEELVRGHRLADLRNLPVRQQGGLLRRARACVTIDNGLMHLSCDVGTQTIAMFGPTSWQLWAPQVPHLTLILPQEDCGACGESGARKVKGEPLEHNCMRSIAPSSVLDKLFVSLRR